MRQNHPKRSTGCKTVASYLICTTRVLKPGPVHGSHLWMWRTFATAIVQNGLPQYPYHWRNWHGSFNESLVAANRSQCNFWKATREAWWSFTVVHKEVMRFSLLSYSSHTIVDNGSRTRKSFVDHRDAHVLKAGSTAVKGQVIIFSRLFWARWLGTSFSSWEAARL